MMSTVVDEFASLSRTILAMGSRVLLRRQLLGELCALFLQRFNASAVEILLRKQHNTYRSRIAIDEAPQYEARAWCPLALDQAAEVSVDQVSHTLIDPAHATSCPAQDQARWLECTNEPTAIELGNKRLWVRCPKATDHLVLVAFSLSGTDRGLLRLEGRAGRSLNRTDLPLIENIAGILATAIVHRRTELALRERVKELGCLYEIAHLSNQREEALEKCLQAVVELLPPAWLFPEIAWGRIRVDDISVSAGPAETAEHRLAAPIEVDGQVRGTVEVGYCADPPDIEQHAFLPEEQRLLLAVAKELSAVVARRDASRAREQLAQQLQHADRLATIGQLAAGVAHEINEPLTTILGFAQLAQKGLASPSSVATESIADDLDKIVRAALHAREIVRKLMLFGKPSPRRLDLIDLNKMIEEGLYVIEGRCVKQGIDLQRDLAPNLPAIFGDAGQLHQVLINLAVNALQAMPASGCLTIRTSITDRTIHLSVEDTGSGIAEEIRDRIFMPFFTTKDVGQGTGLGLSVVAGIVSAHGGRIEVRSEAGKGACFDVSLPVGDGCPTSDLPTAEQ